MNEDPIVAEIRRYRAEDQLLAVTTAHIGPRTVFLCQLACVLGVYQSDSVRDTGTMAQEHFADQEEYD